MREHTEITGSQIGQELISHIVFHILSTVRAWMFSAYNTAERRKIMAPF